MKYLNTGLLVICFLASIHRSGDLLAQASGSAPAAGASTRNSGGSAGAVAPHLNPEEAQNVITVDGTAEIRVQPEELRMVLAAVSEAASANECSEKASATLNKIRQGWMGTGIPADDIFEDFIAILPVYEFEEVKWQNTDALKEKLVRYRMQTNLHVKLANDEQARTAMRIAFAEGVTDIIAFDYWSRELDKSKTEALKKALQVARDKSDLLLAKEQFPTRPKLINISEDVQVIFPRQMYLSYESAIAETVSMPYNWRDNVPRVFAAKPRTTFYNGPDFAGDSLSPDLPMRPAISVVAQVKLFFEAPSGRWNRTDPDSR